MYKSSYVTSERKIANYCKCEYLRNVVLPAWKSTTERVENTVENLLSTTQNYTQFE